MQISQATRTMFDVVHMLSVLDNRYQSSLMICLPPYAE